MITAIDTNILVDILEPDPVFGQASAKMLKLALAEGAVVACDVVWAEIATAYADKKEDLLVVMEKLNVSFLPLSQDAALTAAKQWHKYRKRGGGRKRIAADFLIGGQALEQCDRLLTRDDGFFRDYFDGLKLLVPKK